MSNINDKKQQLPNFEEMDMATLLAKPSNKLFVKSFTTFIIFINIWIVSFAIVYCAIDQLLPFIREYDVFNDVPVLSISTLLSFVLSLIAIFKMK